MKSFGNFAGIALFILALVFSFDLFLFSGRSITFDAHIHMTTFSQFAQAIADGEFPVRWADGFANYGLPVPLFAHQTTSYLGALLTLLTGSPVLAYNLLVFFGAFFSALLMYRFLRTLVKPESALLGSALFMVAPYRIMNVYIRGALPEFFGTVFLVWLLIGIQQTIVQKRWFGAVNVFLATCLLALTHPMFILLAAGIVVPYLLFLAWPLLKNWKAVCATALAGMLGLGAASYYIFPLLYDIRFTNYGVQGPQFQGGDFLTIASLFSENWAYFGLTHPGPRAEVLVPGVPEMAIFLFAGVAALVFLWKRIRNREMVPWLLIGFVSLFCMLPISSLLYKSLPFFGNIQFPWRFLSIFLLVPPVLLSLMIERFRAITLGAVIVLLVIAWRVPQMYGKNYLEYDLQHYAFTAANLHSNNMNTLWMGDSTSYPVKAEKLEKISGEGHIDVLSQKNASRSYRVQAATPLRLVEHTFYFPGWTVYVDGVQIPIEFQDMVYRGMLTFMVPEGDHTVLVRFEDTKVRTLGVVASLLSVGAAVVLLALEKRFRLYSSPLKKS